MILQWVARITGIFFILFLGVFIFGISGIDYTASTLLLALAVALALAWRSPLTGGFAYVLLGIASIFFFNTFLNWSAFGAVSAPMFVLGILFFMVSISDYNQML